MPFSLEKNRHDDSGVSITRSDRRALPELRELLILTDHLKGLAHVETLTTVQHGNIALPQVAIRFGPADVKTPVLALFAGVHGLERIGTRVVISFLRTLIEFAKWDRNTQDLFSQTRLWLVPLINPLGMFLKHRSNANGVDLMRNAPVDSLELKPWQVFGGHRISPSLPWYRGKLGEPMQAEAQAICDFVKREIYPAKTALSVDVHSGYGKVDRFWFPYAKTKQPFPSLAQAVAIKNIFDRTYPNHVYCIEPQSLQYVTHGDLWDYLYDGYREAQPQGNYIPFCLELGSWLWVKKNWSQMFSLLGVFNPRLPHRVKRILRRHVFLFDFLSRIVRSPEGWTDLNDGKKERLTKQGLELWYEP